MFMDAYDAYKKYIAIKLHFKNDKYDYFKYRGQVKVNRDSFETRNDKYMFHKLSKRPELELFLASVLKDDPDKWIGDLLDAKYSSQFKNTQKNIESLSYLFTVDMQKYDSLNEALIVVDGEYPKIVKDYQRGDIMPETLVILDGVLKIFDYWDQNISDSILWPRIKSKLRKYGKFISYDKQKYNKVLKDLF